MLETNPHYWATSQVGSRVSEQDSLDATLRQLLVFINGYLSLNKHNGVVLIAMHSTGCHYVYESSTSDHNSSLGVDVVSGVLAEPIQMDACQKILSVLSTLTTNPDLDNDVRDGAPSFTPLAAALSMGLCYANSCHHQRSVLSKGKAHPLHPGLWRLFESVCAHDECNILGAASGNSYRFLLPGRDGLRISSASSSHNWRSLS